MLGCFFSLCSLSKRGSTSKLFQHRFLLDFEPLGTSKTLTSHYIFAMFSDTLQCRSWAPCWTPKCSKHGLQNRPQDHQKSDPKHLRKIMRSLDRFRSQLGPNMSPTWRPEAHPKRCPNTAFQIYPPQHLEMIPKGFQNDPKTLPKRHQNDLKTIKKLSQRVIKTQNERSEAERVCVGPRKAPF